MPKGIFVAAVLLLGTALVLAQETRELNLRGDRFQPLTWERLGEKGVMGLVAAMGYYDLVSMVLNVDRYPLPEGAPSPFPESK